MVTGGDAPGTGLVLAMACVAAASLSLFVPLQVVDFALAAWFGLVLSNAFHGLRKHNVFPREVRTWTVSWAELPDSVQSWLERVERCAALRGCRRVDLFRQNGPESASRIVCAFQSPDAPAILVASVTTTHRAGSRISTRAELELETELADGTRVSDRTFADPVFECPAEYDVRAHPSVDLDELFRRHDEHVNESRDDAVVLPTSAFRGRFERDIRLFFEHQVKAGLLKPVDDEYELTSRAVFRLLVSAINPYLEKPFSHGSSLMITLAGFGIPGATAYVLGPLGIAAKLASRHGWELDLVFVGALTPSVTVSAIALGLLARGRAFLAAPLMSYLAVRWFLPGLRFELAMALLAVLFWASIVATISANRQAGRLPK